ncbi:hypothetical protein YC2023_017133 [Brassica napus]
MKKPVRKEDRLGFGRCARRLSDPKSLTALDDNIIEEREKKIKEFRELNASASQAHTYQALAGPGGGDYKGSAPSNKRPRSPNCEANQRSPKRGGFPGQSRDGKRQKESDNYWTSKAFANCDGPSKTMERRREEREVRIPRYNQNSTVWNRLEGRVDGKDRKTAEAYNSRLRQGSMDQERGSEPYSWKERHYSHKSQASHQVRRPRAEVNEGKSSSPSRTVTNPKHQRTHTPKKADSQQTISGGLHERSSMGGKVLEFWWYIKTKPPKKDEDVSKEKQPYRKNQLPILLPPQTMLTRDIGTVVFRKERTHLTPIAPRFVSSPLRLRDEPEEPCLDLVTLMKSSHIDDMVLTREEEAEVDKLAEEFGDAVMDETMVQNDDLLVDEPGYDAEIIAISQLSLANDVNNDNSVTSEAAKAPQPTKT